MNVKKKLKNQIHEYFLIQIWCSSTFYAVILLQINSTRCLTISSHSSQDRKSHHLCSRSTQRYDINRWSMLLCSDIDTSKRLPLVLDIIPYQKATIVPWRHRFESRLILGSHFKQMGYHSIKAVVFQFSPKRKEGNKKRLS